MIDSTPTPTPTPLAAHPHPHHWQHTHTWNTGDLDDWCSGCLDLTLGTYTALTEYKENNKSVSYLGMLVLSVISGVLRRYVEPYRTMR